MTNDIECPRCPRGHLSMDYNGSDTLKRCDNCGMVFDIQYISEGWVDALRSKEDDS